MSEKPKSQLRSETRHLIARAFEVLDYAALGPIYCDEGGNAFWREKKVPCERVGIKLAEALLMRLSRGGRSLYVGAGVAEIPLLAMETLELKREVEAYNLRAAEVPVLNAACKDLSFKVIGGDARSAGGIFDHLWIVSVLNDPERYPESSGMAYGRIHPAVFDIEAFAQERKQLFALADALLGKLTLPALVTTSVEEIPWITDWCTKRVVDCVVEADDYPSALVEDPICLIRVGS